MLLEAIQRNFDFCLRAASVFERDAPGNQLFEAETLTIAGQKWLVLAAGLDESVAAKKFPAHSSRAERATIPLRTTRGAQASLLFIVRPSEFPIRGDNSPLNHVTWFAPSETVPLIEVREAFFRIQDLPENANRIQSLRWEVDTVSARETPLEDWLRVPARLLGHNPAHCPSHLHINSPLQEDQHGRPMESRADLRFGCGPANPLAVILSIAAWLRAH